MRPDGLSKTTGSVRRGNCISEVVTAQGKDLPASFLPAFFPQMYLHHSTVPLLHIYVYCP